MFLMVIEEATYLEEGKHGLQTPIHHVEGLAVGQQLILIKHFKLNFLVKRKSL